MLFLCQQAFSLPVQPDPVYGFHASISVRSLLIRSTVHKVLLGSVHPAITTATRACHVEILLANGGQLGLVQYCHKKGALEISNLLSMLCDVTCCYHMQATSGGFFPAGNLKTLEDMFPTAAVPQASSKSPIP